MDKQAEQRAEHGGAEERRKQWSFAMNDDGAWVWKVVNPDGTESHSDGTFKTLKACTENATAHGYVVWKTEEERRRMGG